MIWLLIGISALIALCLCGFWKIAAAIVILIGMAIANWKIIEFFPKKYHGEIIIVEITAVILFATGLMSTVGIVAFVGYITYKGILLFCRSFRIKRGLESFAKDGLLFSETMCQEVMECGITPEIHDENGISTWKICTRKTEPIQKTVSTDDWLRIQLYSDMNLNMIRKK